jgi:predicted dehydrogenase
MSIGWGIVGIGNFANRIMGPAISKASDSLLIAACSRSLERANEFAARHNVKRSYDSFDKMLQDPEIDAIYVATPNNLHASYTLQAAEAGKHVLCDKPMAITEQDCLQMIEACNKNRVKLAINFQNRYHPAHIEARRLVQDGTVGEIKVVKAQYCHGSLHGHWSGWRNDPELTGSGAVVGAGIHPLDLLRFVLSSEVEEVVAACPTQTSYHQVDEMVYAILKFQNGVYGNVTAGILAPRSDNDLVLYGSEAKVTCRGTVGMTLSGELLVEGNSINMRMTFPCSDPEIRNYVRVVEAFTKCIGEDKEPDIPGTNGLQMVRIANAILESSRQGRTVKLSD